MSAAIKVSRSHEWMESLGDWSWPGTATAHSEVLPPAWIPAFPALVEAAGATAGAIELQPARYGLRRLVLGILLSALTCAAAAVALGGVSGVERLLGWRPASVPAAEFARTGPLVTYPPTLEAPAFTAVSSDAAGSSIQSASYYFPALKGTGSFLVYLPPGFSSSTGRYPVLYLLPGNSQPDSAFLQVGLPEELDRLISSHAIAPLIAVMIQGGPGANNWRNQGSLRYESYVIEVQQLIDRTLPTAPERQRRAIAGDSMGGYGAMNIALDYPYRFATVESWLGFFNGLEGQLDTDRPVISALGLNAFVYGGESDRIANPAEDPSFAAALRAAGAKAEGVIYPGSHSLETVSEHLGSMLTFVGHHLAAPVAAGPAGHGTR